MRIVALICLAMVVVSPVIAQNPTTTTPELPKAPRDLLAAALSQYAVGGTTTRPWHIKGTYQLYDEAGNPAQQGSYESWWESPKVYRSTWSRNSATRSEWHTNDGKTVYKASGDRLFYFEHKLEALLFSPVPDPAKLDLAGVELKKTQLEIGKLKLPCVQIQARADANDTTPTLPGIATGEYCFDPSLPVLRVEHLFDSVYVQLNKLTRVQGRVLAQEITVTDGSHKLLVFNGGTMDELPNENAVLIPPADATPFVVEGIPESPGKGLLAQKVPPVYPPAAFARNVSGVVILDTIIGTDGRTKDIRVLETPSPLLASAAADAVAQWRYKPIAGGRQPVEMNTIIRLVFSRGN